VLAADALVGRCYVPLARAAAKYYRRTRHSRVSQAAEGEHASPNEILNWYAYWLVQHGIRLYGKQPPSQLIERNSTPTKLGNMREQGQHARRIPSHRRVPNRPIATCLIGQVA
jgi:hypothetical protein